MSQSGISHETGRLSTLSGSAGMRPGLKAGFGSTAISRPDETAQV
jgi:hypothetical protein